MKINIIVFSLFILFGTSCVKTIDLFTDSIDTKSQEEIAVDTFYKFMNDYYFWYNYIPTDINPDNYANPAELLEAIRYKPLDKWSFVTTYDEFYSYFQEGVTAGFGIMFFVNSSSEYYVAYLYRDSPLFSYGVKRGWKLLEIDGQVVTNSNFSNLISSSSIGQSRSFKFLDDNSVEHSFTVQSKNVKINSVLYSEVLTLSGGEKAGYIVLETFIATTKAELDTVLREFVNQGVQELILDLRYNGGGSVDIANYLASSLAPALTANKIFAKFNFNDKQAVTNNFNLLFKNTGYNLNLNRLVVISSYYTASASEMIINGLKPYINVILIGNATHGKPVGMIPHDFRGYVFVPIMFETLNANDQGRYFDGIPANALVADDYRADFGSTAEDCFYVAKNYLETGTLKSTGVLLPDFRQGMLSPFAKIRNISFIK